MPAPFWKSLELIPGLSAVPSTWQKHLGSLFTAFRVLCLEPSVELLINVPCPLLCGCDHFIIHRHDRSAAIAVCCCNPPLCPDIPLTYDEITPLSVSWERLARAISAGLESRFKFAPLVPPGTFQIASCSPNPVPIILTIQSQPATFRATVAELAAELRQPFILLAPTGDFIDAPSLAILRHLGAAFHPLDALLRPNTDGRLTPLFASPHPFAAFANGPFPNQLVIPPPTPLVCEPDPKPQCPTGLPLLLAEPKLTAKAGPGEPKLSAEAGGDTGVRADPPSVLVRASSPPSKYSLHKGLGSWRLTFDGQDAQIKHERGLLYIAWLLTHPDDTPIHPLDLLTRIPEFYGRQLGLPQITNPATGKTTALESHARLQERSLSLDDAQAIRALLRKEKQLEDILDSDSESDPVKAEALRELDAIAQFQRQNPSRSRDSAMRASNTVRKSITRFHQRIATAIDSTGAPHPVLQPFAQHLKKFLLQPSILQTHITYSPLPGVTWFSK